MTDDIVTRLRRIASLTGDISGHVIPIACAEAADEIERLRAEVQYNAVPPRITRAKERWQILTQEVDDD